MFEQRKIPGPIGGDVNIAEVQMAVSQLDDYPNLFDVVPRSIFDNPSIPVFTYRNSNATAMRFSAILRSAVTPEDFDVRSKNLRSEGVVVQPCRDL